METVDFNYRIYDNCIEITPKDGIKDNSLYKIRLRSLFSENHKKELKNLKLDITTAMTPAYCTLEDVKAMVDVLDIDDNTILRLIRQASKEADFINQKPIDVSHGIPFEAEQFVITKATLQALTRAFIVGANDAGLEGTLGNITFKNGTKLTNISKVITRLKSDESTWREAIRGYVFAGRNKPTFALRSNKTIRPTPISKMLNDYTRNGNMGWRDIF